MLWPYMLAASVTPVDAATGNVTSYILGYGPVGIVALALAWLMFRGWRLQSPAEEAAAREAARAEGRADLVAEQQRLLAEKKQAEELARVAAERTVPLLENFVHATNTLIPILQGLVRYAIPPPERDPNDDDRRR